jgi:hypothetical protein
MVNRRRLAAALVVAVLGLPAATRGADAHPLHSTITELVLDPARGTVRATVRVFADDLRSAVLRTTRDRSLPPDGPAWDAAAFAYATKVVSIRTARGHAVALRPCGARRTADLVWLCLEGELARDAGVLQVRNTMLCELHEDQVNVVQSTMDGTRRTLLFVRDDRFKPLR